MLATTESWTAAPHPLPSSVVCCQPCQISSYTKNMSGSADDPGTANINFHSKAKSQRRAEFDDAIQILLSSGDDDLENVGEVLTSFSSTNIPVEKFVSGGLQNLIYQKNPGLWSKLMGIKAEKCEHDCNRDPFSRMDDSILLHIFSFLDAGALCRISAVSRRWLQLTNDKILWQKKLRQDVRTWKKIGHLNNPDMYEEVECDWTQKEIYLQCCPVTCDRRHRSEQHVLSSLSALLRSVLPQKSPRVAMFGPGLDRSTAIARKILYDDTGIFNVIGFAPGEFPGIGSGVWVKVDRLHMNLVTLYSNSCRVRQAVRDGRHDANRLLDVDHDTQQLVVKEHVQSLCRTVQGFVFVVDGRKSQHTTADTWTTWRQEMLAMTSERWTSLNVPLLVLSCVQEETDQHLPAVEVVRRLAMGLLSRPWLVQNVRMSSMEGMQQSITWLIQQAQRL